MENNLVIKEFSSKNFSYDKLEEFLPLYQAYILIALDENETVTLQDLYKPLPDEKDKEYDKISCIKHIDELIADNSKSYVLYNNNQPVCFALFTKDDNLAKYHLEFVHTAKNERNKGYAKNLLLESFKILKQDAFCVSATVNDANNASLGLNSSLDLPYSMQEQQDLHYFFHIINPEMLEFINKNSKREQSLIYLTNTIGEQEYEMLKNMMKQTKEETKEKE